MLDKFIYLGITKKKNQKSILLYVSFFIRRIF